MSNLVEFFHKYKSLYYTKNSLIILAFDTPSGVYYVEDGFVRMYSTISDGKEITLNIFKPGSYFPMIWAIGEVENTYFFQALTPLKLKKAAKEDVIKFIKKNPDELYQLTKRVFRGFHGILANPEYLFFGSAHRRVISVLLLCAQRFGNKLTHNRTLIALPLTHKDLASICGLARETVTLELQKLIRDKLISYQKRQVVIENLNRLEEIFNSDSTVA